MSTIVRQAAGAVPAILVALVVEAQAAGPSRFPGTSIGPSLVEIGRSVDGVVTYVAHGYAAANATSVGLAATANGDLRFRAGGLCLDTAEGGITPAGVTGNTTAWSYYVNAVGVTLAEDEPKGGCKYTVRVTYALSLTGAVTINQMEYTVFLKGRTAAGAPAGPLTIIP